MAQPFAGQDTMVHTHVLNRGPAGVRSPADRGISFQVADLDGNGRLDIICPGKDGLTVYKNLPPAANMEKSW